jgi:hypothetical protein
VPAQRQRLAARPRPWLLLHEQFREVAQGDLSFAAHHQPGRVGPPHQWPQFAQVEVPQPHDLVRLAVPEENRPVQPGAGEIAAIRAVGQCLDVAALPFDRLQEAAGVDVPHEDRARPGRRQHLPFGVEGDQARRDLVAEHAGSRSGPQVPQGNRPVYGRAGESFAPGREREVVDRPPMSAPGPDLSAVLEAPQPEPVRGIVGKGERTGHEQPGRVHREGRVVRRTLLGQVELRSTLRTQRIKVHITVRMHRNEEVPGRAQRQRLDGASASTPELADHFVPGQVPFPDPLLAEGGGEQARPVPAQGQRDDGLGVAGQQLHRSSSSFLTDFRPPAKNPVSPELARPSAGWAVAASDGERHFSCSSFFTTIPSDSCGGCGAEIPFYLVGDRR